jgi:hypothetical protein
VPIAHHSLLELALLALCQCGLLYMQLDQSAPIACCTQRFCPVRCQHALWVVTRDGFQGLLSMGVLRVQPCVEQSPTLTL